MGKRKKKDLHQSDDDYLPEEELEDDYELQSRSRSRPRMPREASGSRKPVIDSSSSPSSGRNKEGTSPSQSVASIATVMAQEPQPAVAVEDAADAGLKALMEMEKAGEKKDSKKKSRKGKERVEAAASSEERPLLRQRRKDRILEKYELDPPRPLSHNDERWIKKCIWGSEIQLLTQDVHLTEAGTGTDTEMSGIPTLLFSKHLCTPDIIQEIDTAPSTVRFAVPSKEQCQEATLEDVDTYHYGLRFEGGRRLKIDDGCSFQLWSFRLPDSSLGIAWVQLGIYRSKNRRARGLIQLC